MKQSLQTFEFETVSLDERGQVVERRKEQSNIFIIQLNANVKLEMVKIPGGKFIMGTDENEIEYRSSERPLHEVNVPSVFMSKFPITQEQWFAVMQSLPQIDDVFLGDELPVVNVWWEYAQEFCAKLSKQTGQIYRLPSEAEWEYACRAGTTTPYHFGKTITTDVANYNGNKPYGNAPQGVFRQCLTPVGYFKIANAFGLYDMHGNVWEWCEDTWHTDYKNAPTDGSAWIKGGEGYCVQRGGSWRDRAGACRSSFRVGDIAHNSDNIVGLRVCMSEENDN